MITENNIGVNLGFANNRFPEPEVWTKIVDEDMNIRNVQFVADGIKKSVNSVTSK